MDAAPSLEGLTAELGRQLAARYGGGVEVEYLDVFSPRMGEHPAALQLLTRGDVPLPLISLDGEPRFAGGISLEMIGEALEKMGLRPVGEG